MRKILTKTALSSYQGGLKVKSRTQELANSKDVPDTRLKAISKAGYVNIATMLMHTSTRTPGLTG